MAHITPLKEYYITIPHPPALLLNILRIVISDSAQAKLKQEDMSVLQKFQDICIKSCLKHQKT